ncbi:MAG: sodium-dependent transporter, partial [Enterocloster sp.]|nr:sodium-dependent transporter [Enterocloster sp.]
VIIVLVCFTICAPRLVSGVERITKIMMLLLFLLMVVLAVHSVLLEGGAPGLEFYLKPDFGKMKEAGLGEAIFAAMGQSFFTLSIGIGALAIFGSYIGKEKRLTGEAISITLLDTSVAFMSGLIIFPACFAYGIEPTSGPSLIFITLPNVFNHMAGGQLWGALFFVFMTFAALSTVIAVFQNIISFATDLTGCSVKKAVFWNVIVIILLSMPCVLGFNVLSGIQPLGPGTTIQDLEDFIVSNNLLPIGSVLYLLFCTSRYGWGFKNFVNEANEGEGIAFPTWARVYVSYILPLIVLFILIEGYIG